MSRSTFQKKDRTKAASTQPRGGCFSVPFFLLLALSAIFLIATGETTQPWDLPVPRNELPDQNAKRGESPENLPGISPIFTPQVRYWEADILRWANEWDLDPNLVAAVMQIESCGDPSAVSRSGAMGLFQVMPYHFEPAEQPYNPKTNALRGLAYLAKALDTHNSIRLAFAGYNGGIGGASKPESAWASETTRYVYWGTNIYRDARQGKLSSPTLEEWLAAGGASLCAQAGQRLGIRP